MQQSFVSPTRLQALRANTPTHAFNTSAGPSPEPFPRTRSSFSEDGHGLQQQQNLKQQQQQQDRPQHTHQRSSSFFSAFGKKDKDKDKQSPTEFGSNMQQQQQQPTRKMSMLSKIPSNHGGGHAPQSPPAVDVTMGQQQTPGGAPTLHPEINSLLGLTGAHAHKIYFSGPLVRKHELGADGTRGKGEDEWTDVWAQLGGTTLSVWVMREIQEASQQGREVPPAYLNITDAFVQVIGTITTKPTQTTPSRRFANVFTLNTAGSNMVLFSCESPESLIGWVTALRLSAYEKSRLEEIYTAHLLRITLSSKDSPSPLVRNKLESWARIRVSGHTDWKRVYMVLTANSAPPQQHHQQQNGVAPPGTSGVAVARPMSPTKRKNRVSALFSRSSSPPSSVATPSRQSLEFASDGASTSNGQLSFYLGPKPKDRKKAVLSVSRVSQAFGVYPEKPELISRSTLIKVEGAISEEDGGSPQKKPREGWVLVMPEPPEGGATGSGSAEMLKWVVALHDAFGMYGRPQAWSWDPRDERSLMFAYPVGQGRKNLFLPLNAAQGVDVREEATSIIRSGFTRIVAERMRAGQGPGGPAGPGSPLAHSAIPEETDSPSPPPLGSQQQPQHQQHHQHQQQGQPSGSGSGSSGAPSLPPIGGSFQLPPLSFDNMQQEQSGSGSPDGGAGLYNDDNEFGMGMRRGGALTPITERSNSILSRDFSASVSRNPSAAAASVMGGGGTGGSGSRGERYSSGGAAVSPVPEVAERDGFFPPQLQASGSGSGQGQGQVRRSLLDSPDEDGEGGEEGERGEYFTPLHTPLPSAAERAGSPQHSLLSNPHSVLSNPYSTATSPMGGPGGGPGSVRRDSVASSAFVNGAAVSEGRGSPAPLTPVSGAGTGTGSPALGPGSGRGSPGIRTFGGGSPVPGLNVVRKGPGGGGSVGSGSSSPSTAHAHAQLQQQGQQQSPPQQHQQFNASPKQQHQQFNASPQPPHQQPLQPQRGFSGGTLTPPPITQSPASMLSGEYFPHPPSSNQGHGHGGQAQPPQQQQYLQAPAQAQQQLDQTTPTQASFAPSPEPQQPQPQPLAPQPKRHSQFGMGMESTSPASEAPDPSHQMQQAQGAGLYNPTVHAYQNNFAGPQNVVSQPAPAPVPAMHPGTGMGAGMAGITMVGHGLGRKPSGARAPAPGGAGSRFDQNASSKISASVASQQERAHPQLVQQLPQPPQPQPPPPQSQGEETGYEDYGIYQTHFGSGAASSTKSSQKSRERDDESENSHVPTEEQSLGMETSESVDLDRLPPRLAQQHKESLQSMQRAQQGNGGGDDGSLDALAALSYLDVNASSEPIPPPPPPPPSLPAQQRQQHDEASAPPPPHGHAQQPVAQNSTGSDTASLYKSSFAPSNRAAERKAKAQASAAAKQKPGRANGQQPRKAAKQAHGAWGESSDEEEDEEEEDSDSDDDDERGPRRQQHDRDGTLQQQQMGQGQPSHLRPPRTLPQIPGGRGPPPDADDYPRSRQPSEHQQPSFQQQPSYQQRQTYFEDGTPVNVRSQSEMPLPGQARQSVWSQALDPGRTPGGAPPPGPQNDKFVQLEPSEALTKAFTPQGLLAAGMHDKHERGAKRQEELAKESGGSLINVPNKPPPPQTGLLGAVAAHERERKREGGVGAALTEREREKRVAEDRQRKWDEQQRQQMEQFGGGPGSMYGGGSPGGQGFNPMMMGMNPMMMGMNPMMSGMGMGGMGMNPMMTGGMGMQPMMSGGGGFGNPQAMFAAQQAAAQAYQQAMMSYSQAGSQAPSPNHEGGGGSPNHGLSPAMSGNFDPRMSMMSMGGMGGMSPMMGGMGGMGMMSPAMSGMGMGGMGMGPGGGGGGPPGMMNPQLTGGQMSTFDPRYSPQSDANANNGSGNGPLQPPNRPGGRDSSPLRRVAGGGPDEGSPRVS